MRRTFVGVLYDQLAAVGSGTFGKLDRCVTRTCGFFSLALDEPTRRKWRNMAFRYLRCTGHLDVVSTGSTTLWAAAPPTLVERGESDFVLVGETATADALIGTLAGRHTTIIAGAETPLTERSVSFYPDLLQVTLGARDVARLAKHAGVAVTLGYQAQLSARLPSLESILGVLLRDGRNFPAFEPGSAAVLDFQNGEWTSYPEPRPFEPGLYRRSSHHAQPEYLVAAHGTGGILEVFHVLESEWVFVIAMAKLRRELMLRYDRASRRLTMSRTHHTAARLPTLVERLLRSGTLLNPSVSAKAFGYGGLTPKTIETIRTLLPYADVEVCE